MRLAILTLSLLLTAAPAAALQSAPTSDVAADQLPAAAKPKKVCRSVQVTGRRIPDSVCHTSTEWAAIDKANEEAAKKYTSDLLNGAARTGSRGADSAGGMSSGAMALP